MTINREVCIQGKNNQSLQQIWENGEQKVTCLGKISLDISLTEQERNILIEDAIIQDIVKTMQIVWDDSESGDYPFTECEEELAKDGLQNVMDDYKQIIFKACKDALFRGKQRRNIENLR